MHLNPSDSKATGESPPLVSVVMPVYNGESYMAEAIESILTQTYTNFELLIVDDGSSDNSVSIARAFETRDNRIRLFQFEQNRGKADARNCGITAANGEYVAFMDSDDVSLQTRLEKQVNYLQVHSEIGGLGTCGRAVNHDLSSPLYRYSLPQHHAQIALDWFIGRSILGASLMLRRDFLLAVGGFEPGRRSVEDLELVARLLHKTAIKLSILNEDLYIYRLYDHAKRKAPDTPIHNAYMELRRRVLASLWNEAPEASLGRLDDLRKRKRLSWAERRAIRRDLLRLIDSMIAANWVETNDRPVLVAEMNRRLEEASPRRWQQFCHWRRRHFTR